MKNLRRIFQPNDFLKREDSWDRSPIHPLCGSELSSSYLCLLRYFLQFLVWRPAFPWCLQPHCGSFIHPQPMQNVLGCLCIFAWLNIKLVYLSSPLGALAWLPKRNNHLFPHGYSLVHGPVSFSLQHLHCLKLPHWFVGRLSFHLTTSAHIYAFAVFASTFGFAERPCTFNTQDTAQEHLAVRTFSASFHHYSPELSFSFFSLYTDLKWLVDTLYTVLYSK